MLVLINLLLIAHVEVTRSVDYCKLDIDSRVLYCFDPGYIHGLRRCNSYEFEDVIFRPSCNSPSHRSNSSLPPMRCVNGNWVNLYECKQEPVNDQSRPYSDRPTQQTDRAPVRPLDENPSTTRPQTQQPVETPRPQKYEPTTPPPPAPPTTAGCVLPPYPNHGTYTVSNIPNAVPGQAFESLVLNVSCSRGFGVIGDGSAFCVKGVWHAEIPKCKRFCKLNNHPSVHYNCILSGAVEGQRPCGSYEPAGTIVRPECNAPNYYSTYSLPFMRCIDGVWDSVVTCLPECGKVTPDGEPLIIGGRHAKKGELPWYAGIYSKTTNPYMQLCGGSLISNSAVISAAHCFWFDVTKQLPASNYAVAFGKLYRPWNDLNDVDAQQSDVKTIHLPKRFQGGKAYFRDDIAILVVTTAFVYKINVRPVCLNFDVNFKGRQLQAGTLGKIAGWGLTAENGQQSPVLKVTELPYVDIVQCYEVLPPEFREYITSDKICAGHNNGTALCNSGGGDGGGGLAFPVSDLGIDRYYLRGVMSAAPNNGNLCNAHTLTLFTSIMYHEHFIKMYL